MWLKRWMKNTEQMISIYLMSHFLYAVQDAHTLQTLTYALWQAISSRRAQSLAHGAGLVVERQCEVLSGLGHSLLLLWPRGMFGVR